MDFSDKKLYSAITSNGKKVVGIIGYQQTFWECEEVVIIDSRGKCYNVLPDTIQEVKKEE